MDERKTVSIGQLAADFGINPKTIRYYEDIELLPKPHRCSNGYRQYTVEDQDRLRFILQAKNLGFSLKEIAEILAIRDKGEEPCKCMLMLLDRKLGTLDKQIDDLIQFRHSIYELRKEAETTQLLSDGLRRMIDYQAMPTLHQSTPSTNASTPKLGKNAVNVYMHLLLKNVTPVGQSKQKVPSSRDG